MAIWSKKEENKLFCKCTSFYIKYKPSKTAATAATAANKRLYRKSSIYVEMDFVYFFSQSSINKNRNIQEVVHICWDWFQLYLSIGKNNCINTKLIISSELHWSLFTHHMREMRSPLIICLYLLTLQNTDHIKLLF